MGYVVPPTQNFGGDRPPLSPPLITPVHKPVTFQLSSLKVILVRPTLLLSLLLLLFGLAYTYVI